MRSASILSASLSALGGAEKVAVFLAVACRDSGMATTIWAERPVSAEQIEVRYAVDMDGIRIKTLPSSKALTTRGWRAAQLLVRDLRWARAMRRERPDLFINTQFRNVISGVGATNWNYVHFPHPLREHGNGALHRAAAEFILRVRSATLLRGRPWAKSFDRFFANSRFTAENIRTMWGAECEVIYPPCEMAPELSTDASMNHSIVSIGRFQLPGTGVPHKNHRALIEAFELLSQADPDAGWKLQLVGGLNESNPEEVHYFHDLQRQAQYLNISFHPNATHQELNTILANANIYWHAQGYGTDPATSPREQEHFGITVVDAMSAGCTPLVYDSGGPKEIVTPVSRALLWSTLPELAQRTRNLGDDTNLWRRLLTDSKKRAEDFSDSRFLDEISTAIRIATRGHP